MEIDLNCFCEDLCNHNCDVISDLKREQQVFVFDVCCNFDRLQ